MLYEIHGTTPRHKTKWKIAVGPIRDTQVSPDTFGLTRLRTRKQGMIIVVRA